MGDPLTHLRSHEEVRTLLSAAAAHLAPRGLLLLTFRDHTGPPRRAGDRTFVVRGDAERILTCRLETTRATLVVITDTVHERAPGAWSVRTSAYEKLRLDPSVVRSELSALASRRPVRIDRRPRHHRRATAVTPIVRYLAGGSNRSSRTGTSSFTASSWS